MKRAFVLILLGLIYFSCDHRTNITVEENNGIYTGVVQEQIIPGEYDERITDALIVFKSSSNGLEYKTRSTFEGRYAISLPVDKYYVTAKHQDYETYTTCSGFFVLSDTDTQIGNIFMWKKGKCKCPENNRVFDADFPTLSLSTSKKIYATGDTIRIMFEAHDNKGLSKISWFSESCPNRCLYSKVYRRSLNNKDVVDILVEFEATETGIYLFYAQVVDTDGNNSVFTDGNNCYLFEVK